MIDVDNTKPEHYHGDLEPDTSSYIDDNDLSNTNTKGEIESPLYDEYKERRAGLWTELGIE